MKGKEKHKIINSLLGDIEDEQFAQLSTLGRKITDYETDKKAAAGGTLILFFLCYNLSQFLPKSFLFHLSLLSSSLPSVSLFLPSPLSLPPSLPSSLYR